jgi:hypothetical protein
MKLLLAILLAVFTMGQDSCESPPVEPGFCSGSEGVINYTVGGFSTIIGGEISTDRRSAVLVYFGRSYCSGNVVGPRTVLLAAHCGYGATTTHDIKLTRDGPVIAHAPTHKYHPDYQGWIDRETNGLTLTEKYEARKSDLMYLYTDADLPPPYTNKWYSPTQTLVCSELIAQGFGKDEFPEEGATLRESRYRVKKNLGKLLVTEQATWGGSCFGDSGSCLLAPIGPDPLNLHCAGILSTTASEDCLVSANYVSTDYFRDWLDANLGPPT